MYDNSFYRVNTKIRLVIRKILIKRIFKHEKIKTGIFTFRKAKLKNLRKRSKKLVSIETIATYLYGESFIFKK